MNAKEFLKQIKKLDKLIENKLAEAQRWMDIAVNASPNLSLAPASGSGASDKVADAVCAYLDLQSEISQDVDRLIAARKDVISVIEQLSATDYDILHKMYVQDLTRRGLSSLYDRAYGWATTAHGRALKRVQNILNQRGTGNEQM